MFFELMLLELVKDLFKILMKNIELEDVEQVDEDKFKVKVNFKDSVIVDKGQLALLKGFASDDEMSFEDLLKNAKSTKGGQA